MLKIISKRKLNFEQKENANLLHHLLKAKLLSPDDRTLIDTLPQTGDNEYIYNGFLEFTVIMRKYRPRAQQRKMHLYTEIWQYKFDKHKDFHLQLLEWEKACAQYYIETGGDTLLPTVKLAVMTKAMPEIARD